MSLHSIAGARSTSFWDNLNTHKPKQDGWLARHPNVHFHFIPTYYCQLNMVEVVQHSKPPALRNLSCTTIRQLREAIDHFVEGIPADGRSVRVDQSRRSTFGP